MAAVRVAPPDRILVFETSGQKPGSNVPPGRRGRCSDPRGPADRGAASPVLFLAMRLALDGITVFFRVSMPPRATNSKLRAAPVPPETVDEPGCALLVVDEGPWKNAAWAELHAARKRQEKAARDLHRHEQTDQPGYDAWLYQTFPTVISQLRDLHHEVFAKAQRVRAVQEMAAMTGRSARKIWLEQKEYEANPEAFRDDDEEEERNEARRDAFDEETEDDFFEEERGASRRRAGWSGGAFERESDDESGRRSGPAPSTAARDVYRRLVQRLHPDRGGEWTAARKRLWHEVQQAWSAGDADWLARLEIEWEAVNEVLSLASPLSRLFRAIEELNAARRDVERKLRAYRDSSAWRFSLREKKRAELHRKTEMNFRHDVIFLQRQLAHLDALIATWEEAPERRRRSRARHFEVRFCE